jgi:replicative DNA helicase
LVDRLRKAGDLETIGGTAYLYKINQSVANAAHGVYYARIVREKATLRNLLDAAEKIIVDVYESPDEASEIIDRAEQRLLQIHDRTLGHDRTHASKDVMLRVLDTLDRRRRGEGTSGLPTGFAALDDVTGGTRPGEVTVLAGRTSMGKTACASNITEHVALVVGEPVLYVSLEMSAEELGERLLASVARVDSHALRRGAYGDIEEDRIVDASSRISAAPLTIDDTPTRSLLQIASLARRHKRRHGLGLLVLDYLQLIVPDNPRDPRQEQVALISRRCKGLARELAVPVLCLAQLNRQTEATGDKRPRLPHLRESGAIEMDADVVLFVHRPGYYADKPVAGGSGEDAEIIVAKNRHGPTGITKVLWFGAYCRFDTAAGTWEPRHSFGQVEQYTGSEV